MTALTLTAQTAALLNATTSDISDAFSDGIVMTGQNPGTIDPVEGFSRLPQDYQDQGVAGVKLTIAAILNQLQEYQPTRNVVNTFVNGYSAYVSAGFNAGEVTYRKNFVGEVFLEGLVSTPNPNTPGTTMFTLPAGFRPASNEGQFFSVMTQDGTAGAIRVMSDGTVVAGQLPNNAYCSLAGIRFVCGG